LKGKALRGSWAVLVRHSRFMHLPRALRQCNFMRRQDGWGRGNVPMTPSGFVLTRARGVTGRDNQPRGQGAHSWACKTLTMML